MSLIPGWAPNVHPLVIHFPIVLLITAAAGDLMDALLKRPAWLSVVTTSLYVAGAVALVAAYLTGAQASATVFIPGMAHPLVNDHRTWALITTWYAGIVAAARFLSRLGGFPRTRSHRLMLLAVSLVGVLLVYQTADRGGRLVYQHGVGVIAQPGSR